MHVSACISFGLLVLLAARLSPADIHRLHAAVSGRVVSIRSRGKRFMASEFAAIHSRCVCVCEDLQGGKRVGQQP
jgi:phosphatidylserine decarboxylase